MERKVKSGSKIASTLHRQVNRGIRRIKDLLIRFNSPSEEMQDLEVFTNNDVDSSDDKDEGKGDELTMKAVFDNYIQFLQLIST